MKIAPVSADLLIKLGLAAAAIGTLVWAAKKVGGAAGEAGQAVSNAAWSVSPTNNNNVIYRAANTVTGGNENESLGGRIYDWFHPPPSVTYEQPTMGQVGNTDGVNYTYF